MIKYGTCYFYNIHRAAEYYRAYERDGYAAASRKLLDGEIFLGEPPLRPGERAVLIDDGCRYAVETADSSWASDAGTLTLE